MPRRLSAILVVLATALAAGEVVSAAAELSTVETAHYRIQAEATDAEAEEMGKVLEAAWSRFEAFFGSAPKLGEGERLQVFFGRDRASFAARLTADGSSVPKSGGYYSPKTKKVYLWRQPTIYYTRCLLIHEASHQFHYLARTKNRHVKVSWYVEGMAEYLSRHTWDGEELTLGVVPTISLKDFPASAAKKLADGGDVIRAVLEGGNKDRALFWALVRFLVEAEDGRWRKRFETVAKKFDRGGTTASIFVRTIGKPRKIEKAIAAWLEEEQEPWRQIFNQWEGIGPGRIRGTASAAIVTACRVKADAKSLAATLVVPGDPGWIGGLLLHFEDRTNYTTAMAYRGGDVRINRRQNGKWVTLARKHCPEPKDGTLRFEAIRKGGEVILKVEGEELGTFTLPGAYLGLALQGCTLEFRDVSWE